MSKNDKPGLREWLGLRWEPDYSKARWLGPIISSVVAIIILMFLVPTAMGFFKAVTGLDQFKDDEAQSTAIRNIGLVLAAVIGVPFLVWRSVVAQKQVNVAEQGHITDRINKAVEGLGAEKTVKVHRKNQKGEFLYHEKEASGSKGLDYKRPVIVELTEPNLEVRIGAIYALERIAQDSDRDHVQIMEILCAYIRQNAPAASSLLSPRTQWEEKAAELRKTGLDDHRIANLLTTKIDVSPEDITDSGMFNWIQALPKPRTDIQTALNVIGRRSNHQIVLEQAMEPPFKLDLRDTNLQRADMMNLELSNALLQRSDLAGVFARNVILRHADLGGTNLIFADLREADLSHSNLGSAPSGGEGRLEAFHTVPPS